MIRNIPRFDNETEANISELRAKMIRNNETIIAGNRRKESVIKFAIDFTNKYFGIQDYGESLEEIEKQIYG